MKEEVVAAKEAKEAKEKEAKEAKEKAAAATADDRRDRGLLRSLLTARAVREQAERLFAEALAGRLEHFTVRLEELPALARRVAEITRALYPDLRDVPIHGRYRHFDGPRPVPETKGTDRLAVLDARLAGATATEKLVARADLVITSVLLDAGAGPDWSYRETAGGEPLTRSEGLAVASFDWFMAGGLSSNPRRPWRVDAARLRTLDRSAVAQAFQVRADNPLLGLEGRVALLRSLGDTVARDGEHFGRDEARPGQLAAHLLGRARSGALAAEEILVALLEAFGPIWPGREQLAGAPLGDVWTHSRFGRVPFHKLSQWLAYSLIEPLQQAGVEVTDVNGLTGLAEYRNGGLFIDGGVLVPRSPQLLQQTHAITSDVVIEWRALTVALLDRIAATVREIVGLSASELPLVKILEGGTWRAGRVLARERRPDGSPPLRVLSDGTVF